MRTRARLPGGPVRNTCRAIRAGSGWGHDPGRGGVEVAEPGRWERSRPRVRPPAPQSPPLPAGSSVCKAAHAPSALSVGLHFRPPRSAPVCACALRAQCPSALPPSALSARLRLRPLRLAAVLAEPSFQRREGGYSGLPGSVCFSLRVGLR